MAQATPFRAGSSYVEQGQSLQAKMIVLGDARTGKSCLINSLDAHGGIATAGGSTAQRRASNSSSSATVTEDSIFSIVEFPAHELEDTTSSVVVKMWEHNHDLSKEEEELVFRGALFCLITLDLRSPDSANSAFNKWLKLKEAHMPESFLFVVGTYLDQSISRRVEIAELCKACAQRDAVYVEVSNLDGSNVSLLRRLLAQRINYMLRVRELVARQTPPDLTSSRHLSDNDVLEPDDDGSGAVGESKQGGGANRSASHRPSAVAAAAAARRDSSAALKTAFLEQEIVADSVGSILASCLGTEFWPGFEHEEDNLRQIGEKINEYVHRLAADPASAPSTPLEHVLHSVPPPLPPGHGVGGISAPPAPAVPEPDIEELKNVFEIMGFKLPESLLVTAASSSSSKRPAATAMRSTKLRVKLPSGEAADMVLYPGYHVGQQVEAFLVKHNLQDEDDVKAKLLEAAQSIVVAAARHEDEDEAHAANHRSPLLTAPPRLAAGTQSFNVHGASFSQHVSAAAPAAASSGPRGLGRKVRVRIALPNPTGSGPGQSIETLMHEHEDLAAVAKRIARENGLTQNFQDRVLQQLRQTFR